jgi:hypothetical protein
VSYVAIKRKYKVFIKSIATGFCGSFDLLERIQILGSAPSLVLLFTNIIFFLIFVSTKFPIKFVILLWVLFFCVQIATLFPIKFINKTDGYFIVKYARHLNLSVQQTIGQVLYGMFLALRYVFLGSRGVKKYNTKLLRASDFVKSGDHKNALPILEAELTRDPSNPEICNNIAWC